MAQRSRVEEDMDDVLDLEGIDVGFGQQSRVSPVCLAGKLILEKSHNTFALIDVMLKAFKPKGKLQARDWGNGLVMFSFEMDDDRQWVLKNQPWHFDGYLFAIHALKGMEQPSAVKISSCLFWMRAHDLHVAYRSIQVIRSIAAKIGTLVAYENPSELNMEEFVRFRVCLDFTRPLLRGLHIKVGGKSCGSPSLTNLYQTSVSVVGN